VAQSCFGGRQPKDVINMLEKHPEVCRARSFQSFFHYQVKNPDITIEAINGIMDVNPNKKQVIYSQHNGLMKILVVDLRPQDTVSRLLFSVTSHASLS
jgi:hypothetical protein